MGKAYVFLNVSCMDGTSGCISCHFLRLLTGRERHGGYWEKLYADTYGTTVCLGMELLTGSIRALVECCEPTRLVPATAGEAMKLIQVLPGGWKYLSVDSR